MIDIEETTEEEEETIEIEDTTPETEIEEEIINVTLAEKKDTLPETVKVKIKPNVINVEKLDTYPKTAEEDLPPDLLLPVLLPEDLAEVEVPPALPLDPDLDPIKEVPDQALNPVLVPKATE